MAGNFSVTAFLGLATSFGLFFNGFLIFNFIRRKRMRTIVTIPACLLYVQLAVVDIIGALLWTLFTILSSSAGKWTLPDSLSLCQIQVYIRVFCNLVNVFTLMVLMGERVLRIFKPSKHREIFFDLVVVLLMVTIYVFVGTLAGFPMWGWGKVVYFEKEYQCAITFEETPSYYDFSIAMSVGIPGGLILVGYFAILLRIFLLKRKAGPKGLIILEENFETIGDSYSDRLQKLYESFKDPENKPFRPRTGETAKIEDTSYVDSDEFNSDEENEQKEKGENGKGEKAKNPRKLPPTKCYYLGANDMGLTHSYALIAAIYIVLWIPYYVRFYQDTYQYYETSPSDGFILAAVCMTHLGGVYKVPLYLFSHTVRGAFKKTLGIGQDKKSPRRKEKEKGQN